MEVPPHSGGTDPTVITRHNAIRSSLGRQDHLYIAECEKSSSICRWQALKAACQATGQLRVAFSVQYNWWMDMSAALTSGCIGWNHLLTISLPPIEHLSGTISKM